MSSDPEIKQAHYAREKGEVVLRPHEYDGIQEYDQTLPNWWLFIFFAALLAFPLYWLVYYQLGVVQSDEQRVDAVVAQIETVRLKALDAMLAKLDDVALVQKWAADPAAVSAGHDLFQANCIACHGANLMARIDVGNGQSVPLPGLPLKDGEWKYGAKPMDIFRLINNGTPPESPGHNNARMAAWGKDLAPLQITQLTAYLISENPNDFKELAR
jgi:cytochrome c oxidase cbb3-type subunit 3